MLSCGVFPQVGADHLQPVRQGVDADVFPGDLTGGALDLHAGHPAGLVIGAQQHAQAASAAAQVDDILRMHGAAEIRQQDGVGAQREGAPGMGDPHPVG